MGQEYKSFLYLEKNHPEQRTAGVGTGLAGKGIGHSGFKRGESVLSEQDFVVFQEERNPDVSG